MIVADAYVIDDKDTVNTFFSEDSPDYPLANLAKDHGRLLGSFYGVVPDMGEILVFDDTEYVVLVRIYWPAACQLICCERECDVNKGQPS